ncbi:MAG: carboxylating nicotinate-nucleotide diphosphorylase [Deltaproteobacteria bacterium]|nr:carboxylating nicotinate-nucleotide diphosphorylase [Deltaproteobacteria bacterium]
MKRNRKNISEEKKRLNSYIEQLVGASLKEDIGSGDVTTEATVPKKMRGKAYIIAKESFIVAGLTTVKTTFKLVDKNLKVKKLFEDGEKVKKGAKLVELSGSLSSILTGERVALNFLQRLSGIATLTDEFVQKTKGTKAKILDTRKTTPCMRLLERYAVASGGGVNHRFGLFDAILIKDNHVTAAGGVKKALNKAWKKYPEGYTIEVEVKNLKEVKEAIEGKADVILLDNMPLDKIKKAIKYIGDAAHTEVSGGVNLKTIRSIALAGPDFISVGALTHSVRSVDVSLLFTK